ncbi:uncharacterized protein EV154DRAFT_550622 [Mucor mucedo]|uniref:uncharacterized protein n=1 Tax=Mucor mucedo TaxID=29922 RepID=UPI00221E6A1F|nr:uncharacterized protein EV154DRAFT_550622 [Mucor mucedo]KAI7892458.1 hypothetical protein EV154DRAFT_550622 [Mucor mucedo]
MSRTNTLSIKLNLSKRRRPMTDSASISGTKTHTEAKNRKTRTAYASHKIVPTPNTGNTVANFEGDGGIPLSYVYSEGLTGSSEYAYIMEGSRREVIEGKISDNNGNDAGNNEGAEEARRNPANDNGNGGGSGDDSDGSGSNGSGGGSSSSDNEQADESSSVQETLDYLDNQINLLSDNVNNSLSVRVDNLEDRVGNLFDSVEAMIENVNMLELSVARIERRMRDRASQLDLANLVGYLNEDQYTFMRRMTQRAVDQVLKTLEERLGRNPNNLPRANNMNQPVATENQPQANTNQQSPAANPPQEQAPPTERPQENGNNNAPNFHFDIQQLIFVENNGYIRTFTINQ